MTNDRMTEVTHSFRHLSLLLRRGIKDPFPGLSHWFALILSARAGLVWHCSSYPEAAAGRSRGMRDPMGRLWCCSTSPSALAHTPCAFAC